MPLPVDQQLAQELKRDITSLQIPQLLVSMLSAQFALEALLQAAPQSMQDLFETLLQVQLQLAQKDAKPVLSQQPIQLLLALQEKPVIIWLAELLLSVPLEMV